MTVALDVLVTAAQNGDQMAFDSIVKRFQRMAYTAAYTMLADRQLAEDATQEAFIEAYLHLSSLRDPAAFPGWLRRIVLRQGDRLIRGKHLSTVPLEPTHTFDIALDELNPAAQIEGHELQQSVRQAIETLPEHERVVTLLFYGTGYALKEIAEFLEVPVSTIKKRLYDARKHLKSSLADRLCEDLQTHKHTPEELFPARVRLLLATRLGEIATVERLLRQNPLLVYSKHDEVTDQKHGLALPRGYTALHEAAKNGHRALIKLLLDYGANIEARTSSFQTTPLHEAVYANQHEAVQQLLLLGADVNAILPQGLTALHWAAMKGYPDIVQLLLKHGVAINIQSHGGRTPLHWAALRGHSEIVDLLVRYGATMHIQDERGYTPITWAEVRGHRMIAKQLEHYAHSAYQEQSS